MNQFFSLKRFNLLVLNHWANNKKRYGLSLLAIVGLLVMWFIFAIIVADGGSSLKEMQRTSYYFSLFVVGTLYANYYFSDLGSKARSINFLLIPASIFEKFLCGLLYTVLLFFIVLTAVYYLVDVAMVAIYNSFLANGGSAEVASVVNVFNPEFFRFHSGAAIYFLVFFFAIQSVFLLGSVIFKKYNFIKTIISGFMIYAVVFGLVFIIYKQFYPLDDRMYTLPRWIGYVVSAFVLFITPVLWTITYYRLKVKQV